jgi:antitoxin component YwqK of YwqJK toxin-antitoxin module
MPQMKTKLFSAAILAATVAVLLLVSMRKQDAPPAAEVDRAELELVEGRMRRIGSSEPFTGIMVERYPSGALKCRASLAGGRLEGRTEGWHETGQIEVREEFRAGVSHGLRTKWHASGQKLSEANIEQGILQGMFRRWHDNGELAEEMQMRDGKPHGRAISYHPDGSVKAQVTAEAGAVVEQKTWLPGENRPASRPGHGDRS